MRRKAKDGGRMTTIPIYGYTSAAEDKGKWIIDPETTEVLRTSVYMAKSEIGSYAKRCDLEIPYTWNGSTVASIICKPEYKGHTVNGRTRKEHFFENTHAAVIDPETWETAQRCRKTIKRVDTLGEANSYLSGVCVKHWRFGKRKRQRRTRNRLPPNVSVLLN